MPMHLRAFILCLILILQAQLGLAQERCSQVFAKAVKANEAYLTQDIPARVLSLIVNAKQSLDLQIASIPDEKFVQEVTGAANRGVKVRLVLDGRHYSKNGTFRNKFNTAIAQLMHPNIQLRVSIASNLEGARGYRAAVLHRKIVIKDQEEAYVGSSNLSVESTNTEVGLFVRDDIRDLQKVFESDFAAIKRYWTPEIDKAAPANSKQSITLVGPGTAQPDIKVASLKFIQEASKTLWIGALEISHPEIISAIIQKHQQNPELDIRVMVSDFSLKYPLAGKNRERDLNASSVNQLLKAGVPVRWYDVPGSVLHGRLIIADKNILASSADFTERSFAGNIDLGFKSQDVGVNDQLRMNFADIWDLSPPARVKKQSLESFWVNKFENWFVPRLKPRTLPATQSLKENLSYGLEVEYAPDQNPVVFDYYRLTSISENTWKGLSKEERLKIFRQYLVRYPRPLKALLASTGRFKLVKLSSSPEFLPPKLSVEAHGTVEISGEVFGSVQALRDKVNLLVSTLGKGYWQAHVVFPKANADNLSGFIAFSVDQAYLTSLTKSYEKYLKVPAVIPGALLTHYALGPLRQKGFENIIQKNSDVIQGKGIGKGGSGRLINGPALRDDVYPDGLVGIELRQFSMRHEEMIAEMELIEKLLLENQMFLFNGFKETELLSHKVYEQLSPEQAKVWPGFISKIDHFLRITSESVVVGGSSYSERFLFPLRNWAQHPILRFSQLPAAELEIAQVKVQAATELYKKEVDAIIVQKLEGDDAVTALRIAISKWSYNTDLARQFKKFQTTVKELR